VIVVVIGVRIGSLTEPLPAVSAACPTMAMWRPDASFLGPGPPTSSFTGILGEAQGYLNIEPWLNLAVWRVILRIDLIGDVLSDLSTTCESNDEQRMNRPADGWQMAKRRTLVDQAVDAIVAGASRGLILPGDRIVEAELAQALGISRVPVREALRMLESQGVVTSERYKGMRLMEVTRDRLDELLEARVALETMASRRAISAGNNTRVAATGLERALAELALMAEKNDTYGFAATDAAFHRELCRLGGSGVIRVLWESLSRQLTIIFGLSTFGKPMRAIVEEHRMLIDVLLTGDVGAMEREIEQHILTYARAVDYDRIIAERRDELTRAAATKHPAGRMKQRKT
jgi:DNA-binding GntR family transcriptional regulator